MEQRKKLPNASVDLICIERAQPPNIAVETSPPFNSNRNDEVFWGEKKGDACVCGSPRQHGRVHRLHAAALRRAGPRAQENRQLLLSYHCDWHASRRPIIAHSALQRVGHNYVFVGAPALQFSAIKEHNMPDATENRIVIDPSILVGKPVIRRTRIAVEFVIDVLAEGWTQQQILTNYPHLKRNDITACLQYAGSVLKQERVYPIGKWNHG